MSFESDKEKLLGFIEFLRQKEIAFVAYRNLFAALDHEFPQESLADKFRALCQPPMGTAAQPLYDDLVKRVQTASDPQTLLSEFLSWLQLRKS